MISLVIPIFNRAKLLGDTLQSVKEQSFENWECLIVDDGSTDNSINVAQSFCTQDPRFKLLQRDREPKGAPTCRNIGWQNAANEYIVFLDSDDLLAPWALEERLSFFEKNKGCDFVLSPAMEFRKTNANHYKYRSLIDCCEPMQEFLSFQSVWQTSCPTWKKSALDTIKGWDEDAMSWQDGEVHIRALNAGLKFKWRTNIPDVFLRIDQDEYKVTQTPNFEKTANNVLIFKKIIQKLNEKNRKTFNDHLEMWFYRLVEFANKKESAKIIELSQSIQSHVNWNTKKLKRYNKIYQGTKNIPGLRKLVYLLRGKAMFFPERKAFFVKKDVPMIILRELKLNLQGSSLEKELACLQNSTLS